MHYREHFGRASKRQPPKTLENSLEHSRTLHQRG